MIPTGPEANDVEFAGGINAAILRYKGAPSTEPTSTDTNADGIVLVEADLSVSSALLLLAASRLCADFLSLAPR